MQSWILAKAIPSEYEGTAPALRELYRVRTVQCLLIADICKPVSDLPLATMNTLTDPGGIYD